MNLNKNSLVGYLRRKKIIGKREVETDEVLFSANFESDTPGLAPTNADPGLIFSNPPSEDVVTGQTGGGAPGPAEGFLYVSTTRSGSNSGHVRFFFCDKALEPDCENATAFNKVGFKVHMEAMLYIPSVNDGVPIIILEKPTPPGDLFRGLLQASGGEVQGFNGTGYSNTGATYTPDQWQKWELDYVIGNDQFTVTVDGNCATALALDNISTLGGGDLIAFSFGHNGDGTYYIDAVPSPDPPTR